MNSPSSASHRSFPPLALSQRALRRLTVLLVGMLTLGGVAAGMATLIRPEPQPQWLGAWLLGSPANWSLSEAVQHADQVALARSDYFENWNLLQATAPAGQQLSDHLATLQTFDESEPVVVYLTARATLNESGGVELLTGGRYAPETMPLTEVLTQLQACRSESKWLVLDLASTEQAPWSASTEELTAEVNHALEKIADQNRLVLCHVGRPLVSETWGRTAMGYYLEQALSGAADGWGDGRTDGRVTALEASRFVCRQVRQWAETIQGTQQAPVVLGTGSDFDLVACSHRVSWQPVPVTGAVAEYPPWLTKAWNERRAVWNRSATGLRPRLHRRWNQLLLRSEEQLIGGREPHAIERDMNFRLEQYRRELATSQQAIESPAGYSVFMYQDEAFDQHVEVVAEALESLLASWNAQVQQVPAEKAAEARQGVIAKFSKQTASLPAEAVAVGTVRYLASRGSPSAEEVRLLNQLVRARQPQPQYTETLLLQRLAELAETDPHQWPADEIAPALRIARQSAHCLTADAPWGWTRQSLDSAWQAEYDGLYQMLHPGLAPVDMAGEQMSSAQAGFRKVHSASHVIAQGYGTLERALRQLPWWPASSGQHELEAESWQRAVADLRKLAQRLRLSEGKPQRKSTTLKRDLDQIQWATRLVEEHLARLQRPFGEDRLIQLVLAAEEGETSVENLQAARQLLGKPTWSAQRRKQLVHAKRQLSDQLHRQLSDSPTLRAELLSLKEPLTASALPTSDMAARVLRDAQLATGLCQLAGLPVANDDPLVKQCKRLQEQAHDSASRRTIARELRGQLDQRHAELRERAALETDNWQQMLLGSVIECERVVPRLDSALESPTVSMRCQIVQMRNEWLANQFAYKAIDDRPLLYRQLARRYDIQSGDGQSGDGATPQVEFQEQGSLQRPMRHRPLSQISLGWKLPAGAEHENFRVFTPDDSLHVATELTKQSVQQAAKITVRQLASQSNVVRQQGILFQVKALGHTWHRPIYYQRPTGSALQLLLSPAADPAPGSSAALRLRPTDLPQQQFLFAANHGTRDLNAVFQIAGVGQAKALVPAGQVVKLSMQPLAKADGEPAVHFDQEVQVQITEVSKPNESITAAIPIEVLSPAQYVQVLESRFIPGNRGNHRLRVVLKSHELPPGPPCLVSLDLDEAQIPGLQGVTGGLQQGILPTDGTELVLTAEGLLLSESLNSHGEFSVAVDRNAQAFSFEGLFSRRGDPTSPRQIVRPAIEIEAPAYALADSNFRPHISVTQAPAGARLRVRIGRLQGSRFVTQLQQTAPRTSLQQVQLEPRDDGSLNCHVTQTDWPFQFDATGMVGPRLMQIELLDEADQILTRRRQRVVFDDTAPQPVHFLLLPNEALLGKPLPLEVQAADTVSGIDQLFLFAGRPVEGKPPATAKRVEARFNASKSVWEAELPPQKEAGLLEVTAQAINHVGLSSFVTSQVKIVSQLAVPGGEIRGTVEEGPRTQAGLQVQLLDATGAPLASTKTNTQGQFLFSEVKPGKYQLSTEKPSSGRKAEQAVTVKANGAVSATLELSL